MTKQLFSVALKFSKAVLILILSITLFFNISTMISVNKIKRAGFVKSAYSSVIITSGSMSPVISVNDLLIIKGHDSYKKNDIVTYLSEQGSLVTHRITEVFDGGYITQGDANNVSDGKINKQKILGKVVFVFPGVGWFLKWLTLPAILLILIFVALLLWVLKIIRSD